MIIISHRGNINGPIKNLENSKEYIQTTLDMGYHVEIDLRMKNNHLYLGHDTPDHKVSESWLYERRDKLWIHVKEKKALEWISRSNLDLIFFYHENDPYVLISNGYVWAHDLSLVSENFIIPLLSKESVEKFNKTGFYGVCSDFVLDCNKFI